MAAKGRRPRLRKARLVPIRLDAETIRAIEEIQAKFYDNAGFSMVLRAVLRAGIQSFPQAFEDAWGRVRESSAKKRWGAMQELMERFYDVDPSAALIADARAP